MADDDQRSRPSVQEVLDRREHVRVEIVRRLVEYQDVRALQHDAQELYSPALPAAQASDGSQALSSREAEPVEEVLGAHLRAVGERGGAVALDKGVDRCALVGFEIGRVLSERGDAGRHAALDAAGRRLEFARHETEERGLARAVLAEDPGTLAGPDAPRHVPEYLLRAGALAIDDAAAQERHDLLAQASRGKPHEGGLVAYGGNVGDESARGVHAEFRLGRSRGGAALKPRELLAEQVLTAPFRDRRDARALQALKDVRRVPAVVLLDDAVVHLPRVRGDGVEKPPIVRDDDERTHPRGPSAAQVLGEPGDSLDVEVVRGLVEEQDVDRTHERARQRDALALPAG